MARIGIFGGTFNPPHAGHVFAMQQFAELLRLDRVLMIPNSDPPHKTLRENAATPEERLALCRAAAASLPFVEVSDLELRRTGPSYMAQTAEELRAAYPADTLILLLGTDAFLKFHEWFMPERITACAQLAVARRSGKGDQGALSAQCDRLRREFGASVQLVDNSFIERSATSVRAMLAFGCGEGLVPAPVYGEIVKRGLYLTDGGLRGLPFSRLREISLSLHKEGRRAHAEGCCDTAVRLAPRWGADPEKAARAGILHDVTKALLPEEQLILCEKYDILPDKVTMENSKLLHALTGAAVAERVFGECPEICGAIRWHTTGKADMTPLEELIYLSDLIEPGRSFPDADALRALAEQAPEAAMERALRCSISFVQAGGGLLHPDSLAALRAYEEKK